MQEKNKEISPIKKRILQYLEFKDITMYRCYKETGISKNVLSQTNGLSEDNLVKFLNIYKDANPTWITIGEESMLKEVSGENIKERIEHKIREVTPDYILKRYEELVIENNDLKSRLKAEKNEVQYMPGIKQTLIASEPQAKLEE